MRRVDNDLRHLLATLARLKPAAVLKVLEDAQAGYPTGSDEPPVATSGVSRPTEAHALNPSRARDAYHRYLKSVRRLVVEVDEMAAIERFWLNTNDTSMMAQCANVNCRSEVILNARQITDKEPVRCDPCAVYYLSHGLHDAPRSTVLKRRERAMSR